jgi:hypothetical protein
MTLFQQIKEFHLLTFGKEFHAHRKGNVPAMVTDLAMSIFEDLTRSDYFGGIWSVQDSVKVRSVKEAKRLMPTMAFREDVPAVD